MNRLPELTFLTSCCQKEKPISALTVASYGSGRAIICTDECYPDAVQVPEFEVMRAAEAQRRRYASRREELIQAGTRLGTLKPIAG